MRGRSNMMLGGRDEALMPIASGGMATGKA